MTGFTKFVGSDYADTIIGGPGYGLTWGGAWDDVIRAHPTGGGISGGEGNDRLYGDKGRSISLGPGDDFIDGGLGRDGVGFGSAVWASLTEGRAEGEGNDDLIDIESLEALSLTTC